MAEPMKVKWTPELENLNKQHIQLNQERNNLAMTREKLIRQQNENEMVKAEVDLLDEDSTIYKKVGPLLLKQEYGEVKGNVSKRLEFVTGQLEKLNSEIEKKDKGLVELKEEFAKQRDALIASAKAEMAANKE
eukprot:g513.t1